MKIKRTRRSPHWNERRAAAHRPWWHIIHSTESKNVCGTLDWLCAERSQVSYHYLITREGEVFELVPPEKRAWHAGRTEPRDLNSSSVGYGLMGFAHQRGYEWPDEQLQALAELVMLNHPGGAHAPILRGHSEVAVPVGRKGDPGLDFPWDRLYRMIDELRSENAEQPADAPKTGV